ncbi:succinate dehydrogenase/fumarate reductase flavoprotein subunit [Azospirillum agricola]|uniref:FAD-binding protein n=1 Tax=Azospirillum agricola TaxID=1720247 RepID=UPI001AE2788C|nr:FAD-binding protein [Azospirillum agricola]MBP2228625.1 succinate dehydrogenase/fumarate reductase flavoprotein subunit [Azospirillum agricola]
MAQETAWDAEVDLLVAGAGPGGMAAALVGAMEGLDVMVCEKSGQIGGTAATSAGTLWIPGNTQSRRAGYDDSPEKAETYMDALVGGAPGESRGRDLRGVYLATGPTAIDYYDTKTDVTFLACGRHPDYKPNMAGAAITGRAIVPAPFDGRLLGEDFRLVRPPIGEFMIFGGMMVGKDDIPRLIGRFRSVANFAHAARLLLRYLSDRVKHPRGTRIVMGNALVARLFYSLRKRKVPVRLDTAIRAILREDGRADGRVVGAVLDSAGRTLRVRARKGVVLATGGFAHNKEFRSAFMPQPTPVHSLACDSDTGDGLTLARGIGARIDGEGHRGGAFWTPVSVTRKAAGWKGLFPHLSLDRAKPGLIAVNAAGRRFVNEGASYHDFVEAMFESHRTVPTMPAWLVCDAAFVAKYGLGVVHPGTTNLKPHEASGYLTTAPTLEELARKIGVDAAGLADSVRRHNGFALTGSDLDFGKGDTELNRFNGDPGHGPNPCLKPIETAPFVAVAVWPAEIACSAGLATDVDGQVLDENGRVIGGLYACGNDMASVMAGTYPGPGTTLGPALVFAYRVAMHAAGRSDAAGGLGAGRDAGAERAAAAR